MQLLKNSVLLTILTGMLMCGCTDIYELDKYKSPPWLAGKLYTQISQQENLSTFTKALQLTGYDTILNISGSYSVFAPSDEAFSQFFSENPQYDGKISNIPLDELASIVKYHIIQNAWSKKQLQTLDIDGWIDPDDPENQPRAFKRQTLLKYPNLKYWIKSTKGNYLIVDSTETSEYLIVFNRSRKYIPIFYQDFFEIFDLSTDDYEFYFDRQFDRDYLYYAGARVGNENIFGENGFVYVVDKVVKPLLNARQILERELPGESYKTFLELIDQYSLFEFNSEVTFDQPAAREGRLFDSLFNLSYPELSFDIHDELTGTGLNTYMHHNALFIPTDEGFQKFLDEVLTVKSGYPHWPDLKSIPLELKKIILNTHLASYPVYRTDIIKGIKNTQGNTIRIDEGNIIRKEFGSNCTFLGLNYPIVPRALSSVTGPVYLRPDFGTFMYAVQKTNALTTIRRETAEYCFFAIPDKILAADSSLMLEWKDRELNQYNFRAYNRIDEKMVSVQSRDLKKRILNHVGISLPDGSANKEFIETLGGNYIRWNNIDQAARGSRPSVFGYKGDSIITVHPELFQEPTDNGSAYSVNSWFNYYMKDILLTLSAYSKFKSLIEKAGMYDAKFYRFTFLTDGEFYTIFLPSDEALDNYGVDTLSVEDLRKFIKYHFIRGDLIFTDGKKPWKEYETLRKDESSTMYVDYYSSINIRPGQDKIEILDAGGNPYVTIMEQGVKTNIMVGTDSDEYNESNIDYITTAVIHEIDTVLVKQ